MLQCCLESASQQLLRVPNRFTLRPQENSMHLFILDYHLLAHPRYKDESKSQIEFAKRSGVASLPGFQSLPQKK